MKKLLLTALLIASAGGAFAQSKTTGTVSLTTGMSAKVDLNSTTSTATLTLTGPQDRWVALQFGSFSGSGGMQDGTDVVYYNGTTLIDANQNGIGSAPSTDTNDWNVTSNTVSGTTRTIVATRAFAGGTGDFTFNYADANIDFAWARGSSASYTLSNHGGNRGYKLNQAFNCLAPDAPSAAAQSFCAGATVSQLTATGAAGATYSWYSNSTGGTALAGTAALSSGTYYVSQTQSACESARTPVTVSITTVAQPGGPASQTFCQGAVVTDLNATGTGLQWFSTINGFALSGDTLLQTGVYYVTQNVSSCSSEYKPVNVTINSVPGAPGAPPVQTFAAGATVASLQVSNQTGTTTQWYTISGTTYTAIPSNTALVSGTTYYVTQTLNGCESDYTAVTANAAAGVENFSISGLKAYPNPVSNVATISANNALTGITVNNILGQQVLTQKASGNTAEVNMAHLSAGTYIVKVTADNGATAIIRLLKQ